VPHDHECGVRRRQRYRRQPGAGMARSLTSGAAPVSPADLSTRVATLLLPSAVMTAAGTSGYGDELAGYGDLSQLGAVVVKSLAAFAWAATIRLGWSHPGSICSIPWGWRAPACVRGASSTSPHCARGARVLSGRSGAATSQSSPTRLGPCAERRSSRSRSTRAVPTSTTVRASSPTPPRRPPRSSPRASRRGYPCG